MHCYNCGNADRFVLALECASLVVPVAGFVEPSWTVTVQCSVCASTDVNAEPIDVLAWYLRR